MNRDYTSLREDYKAGTLDIESTPAEPISLFQKWFDEAVESKVLEPNAMILSTINSNGFPDARTVLLKEITAGNMVFYTNFESAKGQQIAACDKGHLVFLWLPLERQVRIAGHIQKISEAQSTAYYNSRPVNSQIGAWSSPQSQVIPDRNVLEENVEKYHKLYLNAETIPKPPFWGGYQLEPFYMEFWQGRSSRLHDRIRFQKASDGSWEKVRLAP